MWPSLLLLLSGLDAACWRCKLQLPWLICLILVAIEAGAAAFQRCIKWHQWNGNAPSAASSDCVGARRRPYLTWLLVFAVSCMGFEWVFLTCLDLDWIVHFLVIGGHWYGHWRFAV